MFLEIFIHLVVLLLVSPMMQSVIIKTKAFVAGRKGASIFQPYYDLIKLLRKDVVLSVTTSSIFFLGPIFGVVVPIISVMFIPFAGTDAPFSFKGDFILFIYLFALSRFFTAASALDTGSSFEGMGASREVTFASFAEPTILFSLLVLSKVSYGFSMNKMLGEYLIDAWSLSAISLGLTAACFFVVILVENSRIPFDDPNTHLELTMIHEVMVLDHSGHLLGLAIYGSYMKLMVLSTIIVKLIIPFETGVLLYDMLIFIGGILLISISIGIVESVMARLRLIRIPQVLIGTSLLSLLALVLVLR